MFVLYSFLLKFDGVILSVLFRQEHGQINVLSVHAKRCICNEKNAQRDGITARWL